MKHKTFSLQNGLLVIIKSVADGLLQWGGNDVVSSSDLTLHVDQMGRRQILMDPVFQFHQFVYILHGSGIAFQSLGSGAQNDLAMVVLGSVDGHVAAMIAWCAVLLI